MASATLTTWSNEVVIRNTTASAITVEVTNTGSTATAEVAANSSAFVGVQGQRPDVFNTPGHGGHPFATAETVQSLGSYPASVTVTPSAGTPTVLADGSVQVA